MGLATSASSRACGTAGQRDGHPDQALGDVEAAFAEAVRLIRAEIRAGRHTGMPLKTRGLVAQWDPGREHLNVWGAALLTHYHRRALLRLAGKTH